MDRHVERYIDRCEVDDEQGCWLWTGAVQEPGGYGLVHYMGKTQLLHRLIYTVLAGPIPAGLVLDHLCRVTRCINPGHLEPVTQRENTLRGVGRSAKLAAQTHCKNGHEFTPENTYHQPTKRGRRCRTCTAAYNAARYREKVS